MLVTEFTRLCQKYGLSKPMAEAMVASAINNRQCLKDIVPPVYLISICNQLNVGPDTTVRSLFDSTSAGMTGLGDTSSIQAQIVAEANAQGVPANLALAVAQQESSFNPNAYNASSGATGLFQLMPGTASDLGVDANNVAQNIQGGIAYLGQMLQQFGGNVQLALAGYNAGPGAASTALTSYPETMNYVAQVTNNANTTFAGYSTGTVSPTLSSTDGGSSSTSGGADNSGSIFAGILGGGSDYTGLFIGLGLLGVVAIYSLFQSRA